MTSEPAVFLAWLGLAFVVSTAWAFVLSYVLFGWKRGRE